MREDTRARRAEQIEKAAYEVLRTRGYGGASMLNIAKQAKASNETLYRWYGDKNGLFRTMVESNAAATRDRLEAAINDDADPMATLEDIASILLSMLLGGKAILLNRAAASDDTGELGATIAASGRDAVFPLIRALMQRGIETGTVTAPSAEIAAEWFLGLLIGDLQIRRVIHVLPVPSDEEIARRVDSALVAFRKLCGS